MDLYEKIACGYYETKLPYSQSIHIRDKIKTVEDTFIGTLAQIEQEKVRIIEAYNNETKTIRIAYREDVAQLEKEFKVDLFNYYGVANIAEQKLDKAYAIAYKKGHAYGYNEIANEFSDLVDLIKD